jgi:hypothetical protein
VLAGTVLAGVPSGLPGADAASWWVPPLGSQPWQWELSHPLRLSNARDMGTGDKLPDGRPAPAPVIYDVDGIINPASTVAALRAQGKHVVCYIEVGAAGNYYSAAQEGLSTTYYDQLHSPGVFGNKVPGYPEYYLDIRSSTTVSVIEAMIDQQCAAKGFDAVETDIDEEYNDNSGFPLTKAMEEQYMTTLANYMHGLGLGGGSRTPTTRGTATRRTCTPWPMRSSPSSATSTRRVDCSRTTRATRRCSTPSTTWRPSRSVRRTIPSASTAPVSTWP